MIEGRGCVYGRLCVLAHGLTFGRTVVEVRFSLPVMFRPFADGDQRNVCVRVQRGGLHTQFVGGFGHASLIWDMDVYGSKK